MALYLQMGLYAALLLKLRNGGLQGLLYVIAVGTSTEMYEQLTHVLSAFTNANVNLVHCRLYGVHVLLTQSLA